MALSEIEILFDAKVNAYQRYEFIGATNTVGLSPEQQIDLDRQYNAAFNDYIAAKSAYERAL